MRASAASQPTEPTSTSTPQANVLDSIPWVPVVVTLPLLAAGVWLFVYRRRTARRRLRERRVVDELDALGVEEMQVRLLPADGEATELGPARAVRRKGDLARRGTGFFLAPGGRADWPSSKAQVLLLRFDRRGVRHEVRCRVTGGGRLTAVGRRRMGVDARRLYRVVPVGVVVKRERRDMMRFHVGDEAAPRGTVDARRFVELDAGLRATDLDTTGSRRLPRRLRGDAVTAAPGAAGRVDGGPADVIDFSGTGLRVELALADAGGLLAAMGAPAADGRPAADPGEHLDRLGDRALWVTVTTRLRFPAKVRDLEPAVPRRMVLIAEVARVSLIEAEGGEAERVRLGLAFLYQPLGADEVDGRPRRWELIRGHAEADAFVALHSALNQAAARLESDSPTTA